MKLSLSLFLLSLALLFGGVYFMGKLIDGKHILWAAVEMFTVMVVALILLLISDDMATSRNY